MLADAKQRDMPIDRANVFVHRLWAGWRGVIALAIGLLCAYQIQS